MRTELLLGFMLSTFEASTLTCLMGSVCAEIRARVRSENRLFFGVLSPVLASRHYLRRQGTAEMQEEK